MHSPLMSARRISGLTLRVLCLIVLSCNGGLEPPSTSGPATGGSFAGLITFLNWGAVDTLYDLRLVAFTSFPPGDIVTDVLQGRAVVYPALQNENPLALRGTDSLMYTVIAPARTFPYVVVAHRFGPDAFNDWRPVGQYDLDTNFSVPSSMIVEVGRITSGVDIVVDFANPPPVPGP